jgi:hypothetical protein
VAVGIRSVTLGTDNGGSATVSVTTSESPSATQVGDLVVVIYHNDYYTLAAMGTPTATGSPTLTAVTNGTADGGSTFAHIKAYTYVVNTGGAQTISATEGGAHDEEKGMAAYVLSGADTSTPIDIAGNTTSATVDVTQIVSSISPTTTDAFLIAAVNSGNGLPATSYTSPGSMTERYDNNVGGLTSVSATQQLSASGATGTRTFTAASTGCPWAAVMIAVRTAGAAPPGGPVPAFVQSGRSGQLWRP